MPTFDLAVVGAGIVGLAHALAAMRRGLKVVVLERDARAQEASVRNFGFVTVSGQHGATRRRALRSREVWDQVAEAAGIRVLQRGAFIVARRPEALAVLEEFAAGEAGAGCEVHDAKRARERLPILGREVAGALASPHELRMEAREAIPRIAAWLASQGVEFRWSCPALGVEEGRVRHAGGAIEAAAAVVCAGAASAALFAGLGLAQCKLQMLRLAVPGPWKLPHVVMSDLSLLRYEGFASLEAGKRLRQRLEAECPFQIRHGIHVIVAQSADGSLVVGDSHEYGDAPSPFASQSVEDLVLAELQALLPSVQPRVVERWLGFYPVADGDPALVKRVSPRTQCAVVTGGAGMSTAWAIGEESIEQLLA